MKSVVGLFDHMNDAYQAVDALKSAGFTRDDISVVSRDANNEYSKYLNKDQQKSGQGNEAGEGAAAGAGIGAVLGGLGGFLLSIGALAIPGIGPVIAAGPILATLTGAAAGAAAGGIVGALVGLGIPEEEAHTYAEGIKRGGTLVVVRTRDEMADRAASILDRFNPVDINRRSESWKQKNWSRFDTNSQNWNSDQIERERTYNREQENIPVTGNQNTTYNPSGDLNQENTPRRSRIYIYEVRR
jgi:hypothetical protein